MYARKKLEFAMRSSADEKLLARTWRAPDMTSTKKKSPREVSGVAPASLGRAFRFLGDVS
jgi:hypothetical protein